MPETGKGSTASKLRMKRVLTCLVEGHFGLTSGECWWMNHDQVLIWMEEELPTGSTSRFRVDMVSGTSLVDCDFDVQKRLPADFCPMPKGSLHLGAYSLVDEEHLEVFRNQLARSNPALKLFGTNYLPPPLAKYLKSQGIQQDAMAKAPSKKRAERTTARPTGKVATKLRKQAMERLRKEKDRALETGEQASSIPLEQVTAEDQEAATDGTGRRRFEDLLRQKMGAAGAAMLQDKDTGQFAAASEISEAIRGLPVDPNDAEPDVTVEVSKEPEEGKEPAEEKPKVQKVKRRRLTAKTGQVIKAPERREPAASDDFKPDEMSGLDALMLVAGQDKKTDAKEEQEEAPPGDDGALELSDEDPDGEPEMELELTADAPEDGGSGEHLELTDDGDSGEHLELTDDVPDEAEADDDESGEYLELTADEPDDEDESPGGGRSEFEGLSESFPGAAKAESRPATWEFDATPDEEEDEPEPEPGTKKKKKKKKKKKRKDEEKKKKDGKDLPAELESELAQFLGMAAASPTGEFKESATPMPGEEFEAKAPTPLPGMDRPPTKPKLSRDERRLLPATLGPGSPPALMLRIMDPAQLRRTLELTIAERRAVFRVRPNDKLEAGDPVKIFLSLPGGSYMELEGLVYEDEAPGTHMVVEPLEEEDFSSIREAMEM